MDEDSSKKLPLMKAGEIVYGAKSPINIALVKYWGKAHEELIIPCNSSISLTL